MADTRPRVRIQPVAEPIDEQRLARLLVEEALRQEGIEPAAPVAPAPVPVVRLGGS